MDIRMTQRIKELAHELGADLVGFANIGRFDEAPIKMSPKGIMPTAKTVIVCAIQHPTATMELEGGEHGKSQVFESYTVQYTMNTKLDHISFTIGHFLDNNGYNAVPIVSSNIWRYRNYKELDAVFSPDMSHIYASVCAGLTELGWHGLAMSPEFGPRNRFVSIITDAELESTPLLPGGTLCDMCGECIRCCPTDAYRKEVKGVNALNIRDADGKVYVHRFANKNLWRCAWGEHFDLDLDDEIPDVVTEEAIIQREAEKGRRGGEMGVCIKVCVPKDRRFRDESYSQYNRRLRQLADPNLPISRAVYDRMSCIGLKYHADRITIVSAETLAARGCDLTKKMPGAKNVVVVSAVMHAPDSTCIEILRGRHAGPVSNAVGLGLGYANYDIAREIEQMGYSTMPNMRSLREFVDPYITWELQPGDSTASMIVITDAPLEERDWYLNQSIGDEDSVSLRETLEAVAKEYGADMLGVAPASRIDNVTTQLRPIKDGEELFDVRDNNGMFRVFDPVVTQSVRRLYNTDEYLSGAKSVIVVGLSYPGESARRAGRKPAEAVGPFIFAQSQAQNELHMIAYELVKALRRAGKRATITADLIGMGTPICSPRGNYSSPFDGSFEAAAAGLGEVTLSGSLYTKKYGVNQRFICVVTDAVLEADAVLPNTIQEKTCSVCRRCIKSCPMSALTEERAVTVDIDGNAFTYVPLDTVSCQWASRYVLTNADGDDCLGSKLNIMPVGKITADQLAAGLRQRDPITKCRPGNAEKCITECPLT